MSGSWSPETVYGYCTHTPIITETDNNGLRIRKYGCIDETTPEVFTNVGYKILRPLDTHPRHNPLPVRNQKGHLDILHSGRSEVLTGIGSEIKVLL